MTVSIRVEGLDKFQRAVDHAERGFGSELRKGLAEVANVVAGEAGRRLPVRTGRLRDSLRPSSTQGEGQVVLGTGAVPYAGWIEFGGRVGINGSVTRPLVRDGRYIYPAFIARQDDVQKLAERVVHDTANNAGLL